MTDADVVVVGGGPVGMGLAIDLGQRGIRTIVVERHVQPQPIPKGQNLTQRTMEHMQAWGCEPALRAARTIPAAFGIGGVTAYRALLGPHAYDWLQRERVRPFYTADNERLPQYATEAVLRERVAGLDTVESLYGWTAQGATPDGTVTIVRGDADERRTLTARYIVGCDGARSAVRDSVGITQTRTEHDKLMVLLVFRSATLHRLLLDRFPGKSFFNVLDPMLEGYWKFFGRVDLDGQFFFHAPVPRSARDGGFDFAALLREAAGADFDVVFDHVGFWDLRIATADRYRRGSVFLAGDAAHSHPPYGGYGINTGFEDARNLGWKLAGGVGGWGGERLLNSYESERRAVFVSTARDFIAASIATDRDFLARHDPADDPQGFAAAWAMRATGAIGEVGSYAPQYRGSPVIAAAGTPSAVGTHDFRAEAGLHLPPVPRADGRDALEGESGFVLLAPPGWDAATRSFVQAAQDAGVPLTVVTRETDTPTDPALVLVRPDRFVAWTGNAADDAPALLAHATGQAGRPGEAPWPAQKATVR